jgi:hypothetical protein
VELDGGITAHAVPNVNKRTRVIFQQNTTESRNRVCILTPHQHQITSIDPANKRTMTATMRLMVALEATDLLWIV